MRAIGFTLGLHMLSDYRIWCRKHGVKEGLFGMEFRGGFEHLNAIHQAIFSIKGSRMQIWAPCKISSEDKQKLCFLPIVRFLLRIGANL